MSNGYRVGLDYNVIFHELDRRSIKGDDFDDFMWGMRVIETAVKRHYQ